MPVTNIYKPSNIGLSSNQGVYIPSSSGSQLGMAANNPPVVSIQPAETTAGDKNIVQVCYFEKKSTTSRHLTSVIFAQFPPFFICLPSAVLPSI